MSDGSAALDRRLAALSPSRRRLLERRLTSGYADPGVVRHPLTPTQFGIWLFEQLEPRTSAYLNPVAVRLAGPLEPQALRTALEAIQERHAPLRSAYREGDDGVPYAVVDDRRPLEWISLEARNPAEAQALAAHQARQPFDLASGPVWRVCLIRTAPDEHVLVVTLHHIVSDGWSLGVLLRELCHGYEARVEGRPHRPAPLTTSYFDLVRRQERERSVAAYQADVAYWVVGLTGARDQVTLPVARPKGSAGYRGGSVEVCVPVEVSGRLESTCASIGASFLAGLLGVFAALLHLAGGDTDLVVLVPVAGRDDGRSHDLIGCFVNTVAVRLDLAGDPSLADVVRRSGQVLLAALAHGRAAFADVVAAVGQHRSTAEAAVGNVMFVHNNAPLRRIGFGGLAVERYRLPVTAVKHDWALIVGRTAAGLAVELEYSDRFDEATMRWAADRFGQLIQDLAERSGLHLSELHR